MQPSAATAVEIPSGKDARYENFPVGSWLLPAGLRPHVATFYAFARAADDIADSPALGPEDKIERLEGFEETLRGGMTDRVKYAKAHAMRESLAATGVPPRHCLDLLTAFKQDATKHRYADWHELVAYCRLSAAPVGRFLIDLHGGADDCYASSDALCMALQILNHLQDAKADYLDLDRVYLPVDWFEAERVEIAELGGTAAGSGLRRILDRALDGTDELVATAGRLPASIRHRRLAMEAAVIVAIARSLGAKLRRHDPLGPRVTLGKPQYIGCCIAGISRALLRR